MAAKAGNSGGKEVPGSRVMGVEGKGGERMVEGRRRKGGEGEEENEEEDEDEVMWAWRELEREVHVMRRLVYRNRSQQRKMSHFHAMTKLLALLSHWQHLPLLQPSSLVLQSTPKQQQGGSSKRQRMEAAERREAMGMRDELGQEGVMSGQVEGGLLLLHQVNAAVLETTHAMLQLISAGDFIQLAVTSLACLARINVLRLQTERRLLNALSQAERAKIPILKEAKKLEDGPCNQSALIKPSDDSVKQFAKALGFEDFM